MPEPVTGTNSEKIDALAQQVAGMNALLGRLAETVGQVPDLRREVGGIASTLAVWNRVWSVGVPLLATLLAFLVVQGFTTASRVDLLGSKVDALAGQVSELRATAAELAALRDGVARLEERLRATAPGSR